MKKEYIVTSTPGMTPWAHAPTKAEAIAEAVRAIRIGLPARILPDDETTQEDRQMAVRILGWSQAVLPGPARTATAVARGLASGLQ